MEGKYENQQGCSDREPRIRGLREKGSGSPFLSLLRLQFKVAFGIRRISASFGLGDKQAKYTAIILVLLVVSFIPWMGAMYRLGRALADVAVALNQPGLPVVVEVTAAQSLVFFMTITHLMSTLFYSDDLETLRAMPLKAHHIVLAKTAVVYTLQLLISLIPAAPFAVALGMRIRDVLYWPLMVLTHLFVPALPVAIALLGVLALVRFTRFSARRDLVRVILGLVFFAVIVSFQAVYTQFGVSVEAGGYSELLALLSKRQGLIKAMTRYYPPARWAAMALTAETPEQKAGNFLLLAGSSLAALVLVARLTESWFMVEERRETKVRTAGSRRKMTAERAIEKTHSPATAVMLRDMRILVRTPNFFLTALLNLLVLPLLLFLFSFTSRPTVDTMPFSLETLRQEPFLHLTALAIVGIHGLVAGLNQIPSAAISREGRMFWVSKVIPVVPALQLRAKILYSMVYGSVQAFIAVVIATFLLKIPFWATAWVTVLAIAILWPLSCIGLLVDLLRPKLDWTEPQQAMKGNLGTLLAGLVSAAYVVALGFGIKYLYDLGVPGSVLYVVALAIFLATGAGLEYWLEKWGTARYGELEV